MDIGGMPARELRRIFLRGGRPVFLFTLLPANKQSGAKREQPNGLGAIAAYDLRESGAINAIEQDTQQTYNYDSPEISG